MAAKKKKRMAMLVLAATAAGVLGGTAPANAECLSVEVRYATLGSSDKYILGPKHCVKGFPNWPVLFDGGTGEVGLLGDTVTAEAHVWIPSPLTFQPGGG